jgi:hypothetical protein
MATAAKTTSAHDTIRAWAEGPNGKPATIDSTPK